MRRSKQIKQASIKQNSTSSGLGATRGENFYDVDNQVDDEIVLTSHLKSNFSAQNNAPASVSRNIQLLLQQSAQAIKSTKQQKSGTGLMERNNSIPNPSSLPRQNKNPQAVANEFSADLVQPQFKNHRYSQYDIISHQKQLGKNDVAATQISQNPNLPQNKNITQSNALPTTLNFMQLQNQRNQNLDKGQSLEGLAQYSQRTGAKHMVLNNTQNFANSLKDKSNSLGQVQIQGGYLQNQEFQQNVLRGMIQSNSTDQIKSIHKQNPQNIANVAGLSMLNPSTIGLNLSGHIGANYNNTFVSQSMTRNEQLKQSQAQSNSVKQLPPQHPGTFNLPNNQNQTALLYQSSSQNNIQSAYLQQQKKLKITNQKLKSNIISNFTSGSLQKSMSEFMRKSNEVQASKLKIIANQSGGNGTISLAQFQNKQGAFNQKNRRQVLMNQLQNKDSPRNNSLEEVNQRPNLNERLRNMSLESDNGLAVQNNYQQNLQQNSNQTYTLKKHLNSTLMLQDISQASLPSYENGSNTLSHAIQLHQQQQPSTSNRNIKKILLSPEAQLGKLPPQIPLLQSSISQQVFQLNNKKLELANAALLNVNQQKNFQLPPKLQNHQSSYSFQAQESPHNAGTPQKNNAQRNQFFPSASEKQLLPQVNKITPQNKLKAAQISQQIAALSNHDRFIEGERHQNQILQGQGQGATQNQENRFIQESQSNTIIEEDELFQTDTQMNNQNHGQTTNQKAKQVILNQSLSAGKLRITTKIKQTIEAANLVKSGGGGEEKNLKKDALKAQVLSQFNLSSSKGGQIKIKKNLITLTQGDRSVGKYKEPEAVSQSKKDLILSKIKVNNLASSSSGLNNNFLMNSQKSTSLLQNQVSNHSLSSPQEASSKKQAQPLTQTKSQSRSERHGSQSPPKPVHLATTQTFDNSASQIPNFSQSSQLQNSSSIQLTSHNMQNQSSPSLFDMGKNQRTDSSNMIHTQSSPTLSSVLVESVEWPLTGEKAGKKFRRNLTRFEQDEIQQFTEVFYVNTYSLADEDFLTESSINNGFDDEQNYYRHRVNEHIMYRYEIIERLGRGSFGQVYKCFDHKLKEEVALKIIRNKHKFHKQALVELKILDHLRRHDEEDRKHVIKMKEAFLFRNHLCITFEMLNINLYQMIKACKFKGFDIKVVKNMALQLLITLRFLRKHNIVHCDLKPENILLKYYNKSMIKVIDFGSSCFLNERLYTYIQSRFYRSPEVILGLSYGYEIDIWSFGCIICELISGLPIFSGDSETEQMRQFIEVLGFPPQDMLKEATRARVFFQDDLVSFRFEKNKKKSFDYKELGKILRTEDTDLIDFVKKCFVWEPEKRMTPEEALNHLWLDETIKKIKK